MRHVNGPLKSKRDIELTEEQVQQIKARLPVLGDKLKDDPLLNPALRPKEEKDDAKTHESGSQKGGDGAS
jgi:hypothetical protein